MRLTRGSSEKFTSFNELKEYCKNLEISGSEKIVIKTETDLKNVLYALDERFYKTPRSHERRLANSIVKLNQCPPFPPTEQPRPKSRR